MKKVHKSLGIISIAAIITFTVFAPALAGSTEGTIQGLQCVVSGKICPIDNQDPHIAAEKNFVVYKKDKTYHFVTNMDRAILARYLGKQVRVNGKMSSKYNAITADKLEVYINGKWKTVWTIEEERKQRKALDVS